MCSEPVTFGGGITMENGFAFGFFLSAAPARKAFASSQVWKILGSISE